MSKAPTQSAQDRAAIDEQTPDPDAETTARPGAAAPVLRDESDEIIDNLKEQLSALQAQLNRYKAAGGAGGGAAGGMVLPPDSERRTLDFGLTPHIASRLQVPAEELTERLERLIGKIDDPDIRAELEAARDSAFFLSDTFNRISEQHEALTTSLTADALEMSAENFCERLERSLRQRSLPGVVEASTSLPDQLRLSPQSALTMLMTLAELAGALFGQTDRFGVSCPDLDAVPEGGDTHLQLEITGARDWQDVQMGEAVSTVAIRSGARTRSIVDLLYVEKIIEMRGGSLEFLRQDGRVRGFAVRIPITLLRKRPAGA